MSSKHFIFAPSNNKEMMITNKLYTVNSNVFQLMETLIFNIQCMLYKDIMSWIFPKIPIYQQSIYIKKGFSMVVSGCSKME